MILIHMIGTPETRIHNFYLRNGCAHVLHLLIEKFFSSMINNRYIFQSFCLKNVITLKYYDYRLLGLFFSIQRTSEVFQKKRSFQPCIAHFIFSYKYYERRYSYSQWRILLVSGSLSFKMINGTMKVLAATSYQTQWQLLVDLSSVNWPLYLLPSTAANFCAIYRWIALKCMVWGDSYLTVSFSHWQSYLKQWS